MLRKSRPELFGEATGVVVWYIRTDGVADPLGVEVGDILVQYGDTPLSKEDDLKEATALVAGDATEIPLVLIRRGRRIILSAPPGDLGVGVWAVW
jgi:S1-C subfamily serine protease